MIIIEEAINFTRLNDFCLKYSDIISYACSYLNICFLNEHSNFQVLNFVNFSLKIFSIEGFLTFLNIFRIFRATDSEMKYVTATISKFYFQICLFCYHVSTILRMVTIFLFLINFIFADDKNNLSPSFPVTTSLLCRKYIKQQSTKNDSSFPYVVGFIS